MTRIPSVRQKGETDTIHTQLLHVQNICSLWDGMFIVHDTNPSFAKRRL